MRTIRPLSNSFLARLLSLNTPPTPSSLTSDASVDPTADPLSSLHLNDLSSPTQSDRPIISLNPFDPEAQDQPEVDWKRAGKVAQPVGLSGVGVSVTLIVNAPAAAASQHALYTAYLTVVCLCLFMSMGLSFFSVLTRGSPSVGWVQKRLIFLTLFFMAVACFLRLHLALPIADIGLGTLSLLAAMTLILLYLVLGRKRWDSTLTTDTRT